MNTKHVDGKDKGNITVFALSTCVWCNKTKRLLKNLGVDYDYINIDELEENQRNEAMDELRKINPSCSFPTMQINGKAIVGFQDERIKEVLK